MHDLVYSICQTQSIHYLEGEIDHIQGLSGSHCVPNKLKAKVYISTQYFITQSHHSDDHDTYLLNDFNWCSGAEVTSGFMNHLIQSNLPTMLNIVKNVLLLTLVPFGDVYPPYMHGKELFPSDYTLYYLCWYRTYETFLYSYLWFSQSSIPLSSFK